MIEVHVFRETEKGLEFLLLKRSQSEIYPGIWQMVTGAIKPKEKAYQAAIREILEETGIRPIRLWTAPCVNSFYSDKRDHICMVPVFAALADKDSDVLISSEHEEYMWSEFQTAVSLYAWDGQRNAARLINEYFNEKKESLKFSEISLDAK